jgi:hypothetical protein
MGEEVSPYCNNKFLVSFFPEKNIPCNSETSLSNQLPFKNNSVMDFIERGFLLKFLFIFFINKKNF